MRCPKCLKTEDKVIETRISRDGDSIRRRRQCSSCGYRFTTYETVIPADITVVKRDGRREEFRPEKLRAGIDMACWKRAISPEMLDSLISQVMGQVALLPESEVETNQLGEFVMKALKKIDEVAYVRFASVYRHFQDTDDFIDEIQRLSIEDANEEAQETQEKQDL
ncbi:MAG: transcriptional regulator NrdR [Lentisphaeria bacterium]